MNRFSKYTVLVFVLISLTGCTLEQKLARNFVEAGIKEDFLIMEPGFLFKYNLKTYEITGIDSLDEITKDSLLMENSLFLNKIDDSAYISSFTGNFMQGLKTYGINIYPETYLDTFLAGGRTARILHLAQFSLEEYVHPYRNEEWVDDEIIVIDNIDLNALNHNVWIEISALNSDTDRKVLFGTDYQLDRLEGILKQYIFTGRMQYDYTIDTITISGIYKFAGEFGEKMAGYLYDYFLNRYIGEHLPQDYQFDRYYYHYDPVRSRVYPVDPEESLIELRQ